MPADLFRVQLKYSSHFFFHLAMLRNVGFITIPCRIDFLPSRDGANDMMLSDDGCVRATNRSGPQPQQRHTRRLDCRASGGACAWHRDGSEGTLLNSASSSSCSSGPTPRCRQTALSMSGVLPKCTFRTDMLKAGCMCRQNNSTQY